YAGGLTSHSGLVSPGEWYLFMQAVGFFWFPLISIASFWSQFQDGLSASERVFALIDAEPKVVQLAAEPVGPHPPTPPFGRPLRRGGESPLSVSGRGRGRDPEGIGDETQANLSTPEPPGGGKFPLSSQERGLGGEVEFRHVHFSYNDNEIVLPDFSLAIAPQETIALVGHTGAGKSSIIKLLTRFYEFQGGQLLLDGRDIRRLDLSQYRRQLGLVSQTPFLFSASVGANIRYSRPEASDAEVRQAALGISQGDWLADLPRDLDTDVGERGANLSLG